MRRIVYSERRHISKQARHLQENNIMSSFFQAAKVAINKSRWPTHYETTRAVGLSAL